MPISWHNENRINVSYRTQKKKRPIFFFLKRMKAWCGCGRAYTYNSIFHVKVKREKLNQSLDCFFSVAFQLIYNFFLFYDEGKRKSKDEHHVDSHQSMWNRARWPKTILSVILYIEWVFFSSHAQKECHSCGKNIIFYDVIYFATIQRERAFRFDKFE